MKDGSHFLRADRINCDLEAPEITRPLRMPSRPAELASTAQAIGMALHGKLFDGNAQRAMDASSLSNFYECSPYDFFETMAMASSVKIATFNINKRLPNLLTWLTSAEPDVACLQELKCTDREFPVGAGTKAGYYAVWRGQKT